MDVDEIEPILIVADGDVMNTSIDNIIIIDDGNNPSMNIEIELECYESEHFSKFQYTVDDILFVCSMAATIFNIIVILCASKLFKRSGDTMHLFIISMTLGDLLLTVFCHPNEFLTRKHEYLKQLHLCTIVHFGNWLGLAASGLSLTLLNVDKLIFFQWPLRYDQTMSKRRACAFCLAIWLVSTAYVSFVWINGVVTVASDCTLQLTTRKKMFFYEVFMIVFCVLPVTSSLFVSIYLFRLTREKRNAPIQQIEQSTVRTKIKSLVFIFATTTWTSTSLLPYRIFNLSRIYLFQFENLTCDQKQQANWLAWLLLYLLMLNPIVNPLITSLIYAPYRIAIKKFLSNIQTKNSRRPHSSSRGGVDHTDTSLISIRRSRTNRMSTNDQEMMLHRTVDTNTGWHNDRNKTNCHVIEEYIDENGGTSQQIASRNGYNITGQMQPERPKSYGNYPNNGSS